MDTIKTTLELGGITMTYPGADCMVCFGYKQGPTPDTYNCNYMKVPLNNSVFDVPFYIECKDDPSKLHKFCEMKYCGLVDNPHYKGVGDMLRETIKKFDGCLVFFTGSQAVLVTKSNLFHIGCREGVKEVLGYVLTEVEFTSGARFGDVTFNRIDASKIPNVWAYLSSGDEGIRSACELLKDVEP